MWRKPCLRMESPCSTRDRWLSPATDEPHTARWISHRQAWFPCCFEPTPKIDSTPARSIPSASVGYAGEKLPPSSCGDSHLCKSFLYTTRLPAELKSFHHIKFHQQTWSIGQRPAATCQRDFWLDRPQSAIDRTLRCPCVKSFGGVIQLEGHGLHLPPLPHCHPMQRGLNWWHLF